MIRDGKMRPIENTLQQIEQDVDAEREVRPRGAPLERQSANGTYRGSATVRVLARGVGGHWEAGILFGSGARKPIAKDAKSRKKP